MSWNFPGNSGEEREFFRQCLNFLKTEVEQIKKQLLPTPDNLIGVPIGGPLTAEPVELPFDPDPPGEEGGGGGGETRSFVIGKTTASVAKGNAVNVQVWYWNGSSHQQDPSAGTISAYSLYGAVGSGKYVGCHKDIDTDKWYIIAAECA